MQAIKTLNGSGTTGLSFVKNSWSGIAQACYLDMIFSAWSSPSASDLASLLSLTLIYPWDTIYGLKSLSLKPKLKKKNYCSLPLSDWWARHLVPLTNESGHCLFYFENMGLLEPLQLVAGREAGGGGKGRGFKERNWIIAGHQRALLKMAKSTLWCLILVYPIYSRRNPFPFLFLFFLPVTGLAKTPHCASFPLFFPVYLLYYQVAFFCSFFNIV